MFVFLHAQALYLMMVLARKVHTYQVALENEQIPRKRQVEYLDWLSAFAFVQLFLGERGVFNVSRLIAWLSTNVFPIGLLLLQVAIICAFNWRVYGGSPIMWLESMGAFKQLASRWAYNGKGLVSGWAALVWVGFTQALGALVILFIALYAHLPKFDPNTVTQDRAVIHRTSNTPGDSNNAVTPFVQAMLDGGNLLNEGPCEWWGFSCRYLDIEGETLVKETAEAQFQLSLKDVPSEEVTTLRRDYSAPFVAARRNFRFADFNGAFAPGIDLQGADLRGSVAEPWPNDDDRADFTGANLKLASLDGADWGGVLLNKAVLTGAHANGAVLQNARMKEASIGCVGLTVRDNQLVGLQCAELQGAFGQPAGWLLAELSGAQFDFAPLTDKLEDGRLKLQPAETWLSAFITDEMREQKVRWRGGDISVADHVKEWVLHGVAEGVFSRGPPNRTDLVAHTREPASLAEEATPEGWPRTINPMTSKTYYGELRRNFT